MVPANSIMGGKILESKVVLHAWLIHMDIAVGIPFVIITPGTIEASVFIYLEMMFSGVTLLC